MVIVNMVEWTINMNNIYLFAYEMLVFTSRDTSWTIDFERLPFRLQYHYVTMFFAYSLTLFFFFWLLLLWFLFVYFEYGICRKFIPKNTIFTMCEIAIELFYLYLADFIKMTTNTEKKKITFIAFLSVFFSSPHSKQ